MKSSDLARDSIDVTALENLVYDTVASFGARGCISDEVRAKHPHLAYSSITARYYNLEKQGRIVRPGSMRPGVSGRLQSEMWADKYVKSLVVVPDPTGEISAYVCDLRHRIKEYVNEPT